MLTDEEVEARANVEQLGQRAIALFLTAPQKKPSELKLEVRAAINRLLQVNRN